MKIGERDDCNSPKSSAIELDDLMRDIDPYEYMDQIDSIGEDVAVHTLTALQSEELRKGAVTSLNEYLSDMDEGEEDYEKLIELIERIEAMDHKPITRKSEKGYSR